MTMKRPNIRNMRKTRPLMFEKKNAERRFIMRKWIVPAVAAASLATLGACSTNHAGEGALVGAAVGAGVGAATGGDVGEGAAIGAAAGAVGGALIKKDGKCYRRDRYGDERRVSCRRYR